jgi:hypothetical protein
MRAELSEWRQKIEAVTGFEGEKIAGVVLEFLDGEHAARAAELRWSDLELFGLFQGDLATAARRADTLGLIPSMIVGAQHTYTITAIESGRAVLLTNGGATLTKPRQLPSADLAVPFWEHPAFRGRAR